MNTQLSPFNVALLVGLASFQSTVSAKAETRPLGAQGQQISFAMNPLGVQPQHQIDQSPARIDQATVGLLRSLMVNRKYNHSAKEVTTHSIQIQQWFSDMSDLLADIPSEAVREDAPAPSDAVLKSARSALAICSKTKVSEPSITHDDKGGVEIFFRNKDKAVLIALQADGFVTLYGDDPDEQWRGRYKSSGTAWKRHLLSHIIEVAAV